jgi:NitT/TauT family transport system substrate-binding protein
MSRNVLFRSVPFRGVRFRSDRFISCLGLLAILLLAAGCSSKPNVAEPSKQATNTAPARDKVKLLLNWYPEAEHGGFYAALVHGLYEKHGLDVEVLPGGRTSAVTPELVLGRVQFGVGNADDIYLGRNEESPLVALMAPLQINPRCIMVRKDSGITSLAELKNIKLEADVGRPDIAFLQSKGLLHESVQVVPYFGSVAQIVAGPGTAQQAYSFSEPFLAQQEGVQVTNLMLAELGYNPYACVLMSTDKYVAENKDIARRMVAACIEGWQQYLRDPAKTNEYILKQNQQGMTKEALDFGAVAMKELCLPSGMPESELGKMTPERWTTLFQQMVDLKLIDPNKIKPEAGYLWPVK